MTRFDDSASRTRHCSLRSTSGSVSLKRLRVLAFGAALSVASFSAATAFSAGFGASSAAAAASKSQYLQSQRQQAAAQQAYAQQQAQQQAYAQQQAQMQAQQAYAQQQAQMQAQQAAYAQQQAEARQNQNGSSKRLFSWGQSDSNAEQQRMFQNLGADRAPQQEQEKNFLGFKPLLKRAVPPDQNGQYAQRQQQQQQQAQSQQRSLLPQSPFGLGRSDPDRNYASAPLSGSYSSAQTNPSQRSIFSPQDGVSNARPSYARSSAPSAEALAQASTDRNEGREVLARVPWDRLSPKAQTKLQSLTSSPTIYRRLPMAGGRCNPELFDFFLTHPNAVVELWRSMGFEDVAMRHEGNNVYSMSEKSGSSGKLQILYQDSELTLAYCSGSYRGPALGRQLTGEAFLVLQTRYTEDVDLTPLVVCRLDAFIELNNPGVDLLARTFSSTIGKIADSNFQQTLAFIDSVSQTIEQDPQEFEQVAFSLQGLDPNSRKLLAAKTERIAAQAAARARGEIVNYELLPKINEPQTSIARILAREKRGYGARPNAVAASPRPAAPVSDGFANSGPSEGFAASAPTSPGLRPRSSSLGKTIEFSKTSTLSSNDFSLADDEEDFEASIDWEDDEETVELPSSTYTANRLTTPGSSLAKVGAKPSARSEALDLLEEQESRLAPSYAAAPSSLATDDEIGSDEFALTDDALTLDADEPNEEIEADSIVAIPSMEGASSAVKPLTAQPLATDDAPTLLTEDESDSVVAFPLGGEDAEDESNASKENEPLIMLDLPADDFSLNDDSGDDLETEAFDAPGENSDDALQPLPLIAEDDEPVHVEENAAAQNVPPRDAVEPLVVAVEEEEAPQIASTVPNDADLPLIITVEEETDVNARTDANTPLIVEVEDAETDAETATPATPRGEARTTKFTPVVKSEKVESGADSSAEESVAEKAKEKTKNSNEDWGWTPVQTSASAHVKIDVQAQAVAKSVKKSEASGWSADDSEVAQSQVPGKFVTRRYQRDRSNDAGARTLDGYQSDWREPEKTAAVDSPSFKRPR